MESTFAVIAEPNRRAILRLLATSGRAVGELEAALRMPPPSVSKHLRVLREPRFGESRVEPQRRVYRRGAEPLIELDTWLAPFGRFWSARVGALECHLDGMARPDRPDRPARKRRKR